MKRLIFATVILLSAAVLVTVFYFKSLDNTTQHTSLVLRTIPNDASLIFEFNNEKGFYDIFTDNKLFTAVVGEEKMAELAELRKLVLLNPLFEPYLGSQNIFISLHPQKGNDIDFLLTTSISKEFEFELFEQGLKQQHSGVVINTATLGGKPGYTIYLNDLKKRLYLIETDDHTLSASFSKDLMEACARYDYKKEKEAFVLLSDKQNSTSLANLYINYQALSPLFEQLFLNKNVDIFKSFRQMPAFAALSLNYKSDALMFNGITQLQNGVIGGYLNIFSKQQPVVNQLKEIFPSTTAYSTSFSITDPGGFEADLANWQATGDFNTEKTATLKKIKSEAGVDVKTGFTRLLGNEFAMITTRYQEKIAIVKVKDGSKMRTLLVNISKMTSDNTGQFNYDKVPQILLGDAFSILKKPYFKVIDNYLVLTNSSSELASYDDSYANHKFINKTEGFSAFNELLSERSNVSFFIQFKNALPLFKEQMKPSFYEAFENMAPGWKDFYGASWQFTASEKNYYTNFGIKLLNDTAALKN